MARASVLLLYVSVHLLKESGSLQWLQEMGDGTEIVKCSGEDVQFPWHYALEEGDTLVGVSWNRRRTGEEKEATLGSYAFQKFTREDERLSRSQTKLAGIQLSDLQINDTGAYIVNVRLSGRGVATQTLYLQVAEPPETQTGRLVVMGNGLLADITTQSQAKSLSSNGNDRLMCGQFTDLGTPPVSVLWEDPDGDILPSTSYEQGYFILELPEQRKGGNYYCLLNLSSTAAGCLPEQSALRDKVAIGVQKLPTPSAEASMSGGLVAGITVAVIVIVIILVVVLVVLLLRNRRGKSYAPKEPDSPGPEDDAAQPFKVM